MNFWLIPILFFVPVQQSSHPPDEVVERLAKAGVFAFGPVGYAAITSPGEKDYRTVFNRNPALEDFEKLYSTGTCRRNATPSPEFTGSIPRALKNWYNRYAIQRKP